MSKLRRGWRFAGAVWTCYAVAPHWAHPQHRASGRAWVELSLAIISAALGFWLVLPFEALTGRGFEAHPQIVCEHIWGEALLCAAIAHVAALWANGKVWWSPFVRVVALLVHTLTLGTFLGGLLASDWQVTGTPVYSTFVLMLLVASYQAGMDAAASLVRRFR